MMELISFNNNLHNSGSFHFVLEMIFIKNLIVFYRRYCHINLKRQTCCTDVYIVNININKVTAHIHVTQLRLFYVIKYISSLDEVGLSFFFWWETWITEILPLVQGHSARKGWNWDPKLCLRPYNPRSLLGHYIPLKLSITCKKNNTPSMKGKILQL